MSVKGDHLEMLRSLPPRTPGNLRSPDRLSALPLELFTLVLSYLQVPSILTLLQVSKRFKFLVENIVVGSLAQSVLPPSLRFKPDVGRQMTHSQFLKVAKGYYRRLQGQAVRQLIVTDPVNTENEDTVAHHSTRVKVSSARGCYVWCYDGRLFIRGCNINAVEGETETILLSDILQNEEDLSYAGKIHAKNTKGTVLLIEIKAKPTNVRYGDYIPMGPSGSPLWEPGLVGYYAFHIPTRTVLWHLDQMFRQHIDATTASLDLDTVADIIAFSGERDRDNFIFVFNTAGMSLRPPMCVYNWAFNFAISPCHRFLALLTSRTGTSQYDHELAIEPMISSDSPATLASYTWTEMFQGVIYETTAFFTGDGPYRLNFIDSLQDRERVTTFVLSLDGTSLVLRSQTAFIHPPITSPGGPNTPIAHLKLCPPSIHSHDYAPWGLHTVWTSPLCGRMIWPRKASFNVVTFRVATVQLVEEVEQVIYICAGSHPLRRPREEFEEVEEDSVEEDAFEEKAIGEGAMGEEAVEEGAVEGEVMEEEAVEEGFAEEPPQSNRRTHTSPWQAEGSEDKAKRRREKTITRGRSIPPVGPLLGKRVETELVLAEAYGVAEGRIPLLRSCVDFGDQYPPSAAENGYADADILLPSCILWF